MGIDWTAWAMDHFTVGWIVWMIFFFVWEFYGIAAGAENTLTWHLRPLFHAAPPTWYIGVAVWLWLGPHFFWPGLEERIARLVGG